MSTKLYILSLCSKNVNEGGGGQKFSKSCQRNYLIFFSDSTWVIGNTYILRIFSIYSDSGKTHKLSQHLKPSHAKITQ